MAANRAVAVQLLIFSSLSFRSPLSEDLHRGARQRSLLGCGSPCMLSRKHELSGPNCTMPERCAIRFRSHTPPPHHAVRITFVASDGSRLVPKAPTKFLRCWPAMQGSLDGRNRAIVIAESLARVIAAIRIASVRWPSYLPQKQRN